MKIKDLGLSERPRERLRVQGAEALSNAELIAIIIGSGTKEVNAIEVAHLLLKEGEGRLSNLSTMSVEAIRRIKGVGVTKATVLKAIFEIGRRFIGESEGDRISIRDSKIAYKLMKPLLKGLVHEEFWVVFLNRANNVISKQMLSTGGTTATIIDVKIVVKMAIEKLAQGVILYHNHPSGNPTPGQADIKETSRVRNSLEIFNISLVDHIIIGDGKYYSFAEEKVFYE